MSKCASCDQHGASIYCPDADDVYCYECYEEKLIDDECDDDHDIPRSVWFERRN
jgi:hypothetical protein